MSQGEFGIEMSGGYSGPALGNFNDNFTNVFNYGYLTGMPAYVTATAVSGIMQADVKFRYAVAAGLPIYLRLGITKLEDTEILRDPVSGSDIATSTVSFNETYIGAGLKYGFKISPAFSIFLGADGGCFIPLSSYWEVIGHPGIVPYVSASDDRIDFTDVYFGGNINAGIEWAINSAWGITAEGGYKIAKSPVTYVPSGIFAKTGFNFNELDFSGPYASVGLVFYFGGKAAPARTAAPAARAVMSAGDYYYSHRQYAKALQAYSAEFAKTHAIVTYRKVGICFYVMGMKDKAAYVFARYLKTVPNDSQVRALLQKLKK